MKNLEISNLLLNEILKSPVEIINIGEFKCMIRNSTYFDNEQMGIVYRYLYGNREIRFISLYEIAFKCKEWAYRRGFCIYSGYSKNSINLCIAELNGWICETLDFKMIFNSNSEIEAIIKACEWILEKEIQEEYNLQLQEDLAEYNKLLKEGL